MSHYVSVNINLTRRVAILSTYIHVNGSFESISWSLPVINLPLLLDRDVASSVSVGCEWEGRQPARRRHHSHFVPRSILFRVLWSKEWHLLGTIPGLCSVDGWSIAPLSIFPLQMIAIEWSNVKLFINYINMKTFDALFDCLRCN